MITYRTISEANHFIILDRYIREWQVAECYQSENDLEHELIEDLVKQGYEFLRRLNTPEAMLANVRAQLQTLNNGRF